MANRLFSQLKYQTYGWIICSFFSIGTLITIVLNYDPFLHSDMLWKIFLLIIMLSILWWFWIMRLAYDLIVARAKEINEIKEINMQILEVRQQIDRFLKNNLL